MKEESNAVSEQSTLGRIVRMNSLDAPALTNSGLWPDSATLVEYEKLSPGIAKKILETLLVSLSEESKLRRENEHRFVEQLTLAIPRGQYFALGSVVITALLGGYLAWLKYPWASSIVVGMDLALLVGSFISSSVRSLPTISKALIEKKEQNISTKEG